MHNFAVIYMQICGLKQPNPANIGQKQEIIILLEYSVLSDVFSINVLKLIDTYS